MMMLILYLSLYHLGHVSQILYKTVVVFFG